MERHIGAAWGSTNLPVRLEGEFGTAESALQPVGVVRVLGGVRSVGTLNETLLVDAHAPWIAKGQAGGTGEGANASCLVPGPGYR